MSPSLESEILRFQYLQVLEFRALEEKSWCWVLHAEWQSQKWRHQNHAVEVATVSSLVSESARKARRGYLTENRGCTALWLVAPVIQSN